MTTPSLPDIVRLIWPDRPFVHDGAVFVFDDGLPAPSDGEITAAHDRALILWQAEQAAKDVPSAISKRQLRRWLLQNGLLSAVPARIAQIADPGVRAAVEIDWECAAEFQADHPLVVSLAADLGLSRENLHAAWREAAQIS